MQFLCVSGLTFWALLGGRLRIRHQVAQRNPDFSVMVKTGLQGLRRALGRHDTSVQGQGLGHAGKAFTTYRVLSIVQWAVFNDMYVNKR